MKTLKERTDLSEKGFNIRIPPDYISGPLECNKEWDKYGNPEHFYMNTDYFIKDGLINYATRQSEANQILTYIKNNMKGKYIVADLGGGIGLYGDILAEVSDRIDLVEADRSRILHYNRSLYKGDPIIKTLGWTEFTKNGQFYDIIIALDFLEHFQNPKEIIQMLRDRCNILLEKSWFTENSYKMHYASDINMATEMPGFQQFVVFNQCNLWVRKTALPKYMKVVT